MILFDILKRKRPGRSGDGSRNNDGSKFEHFDFTPERFECSLSSLSHSRECEDLFMDRFTRDEIMSLLRRVGITDLCAAKGYRDPLVIIGKDDNRIHRFRLYDGKDSPGRLLMELRLSGLVYTPDPAMTGGVIGRRRYNAIAVEWLALQNPRGRFTADRPRLPGQDHPGLGGVGQIVRLLETFAGELAVAAVLDVPSHFHAAVMYSRRFHFTDPMREGMMRGVLRDLGHHSLTDLSWAFVTGDIRDAHTGEPVSYVPSEQVLPVDADLAHYFTSRQYRRASDQAMLACHYAIDTGTMRKKRKAAGN